MSLAEIVQMGFSLGYAEEGQLPLSPRSKMVCEALESVAEGDHAPETLTRLVMEAGRAEGQRSKRYRAHVRLYGVHTEELTKVYQTILGRLPKTAAKELSDTARANDTDPQIQRAAIAARANQLVRAQVTPEDRARLRAISAGGWAHATAYGHGEAAASPTTGGPPQMARVGALAAAAYAALGSSAGKDEADQMIEGQLDATAYRMAVATGDGIADYASPAAKAMLMDTDPASRAYADQLHGALTAAFIGASTAADPTVQFNWVNGGPSPCDACVANSLNAPYTEDGLPDYPVHPNCLCDIEVASPVPALA